MESTNRNFPKVSNHFVSVKDGHVAVPQLIRALFHPCVRGVLLLEIQGLKYLEGAPSVIHKNLVIQIGVVVAIHSESTTLRQGVDDGRMSMIDASSLYTAEAEVAHCL